ncbi:hypothetical protein EJB05_34790, partial [Eragrostis curvula]
MPQLVHSPQPLHHPWLQLTPTPATIHRSPGCLMAIETMAFPPRIDAALLNPASPVPVPVPAHRNVSQHEGSAVGALELGLYSYVYVGTTLGDIRAHVSKDMRSKNEASWNALICGLAFNARGHDAIQQQFELMRNEEGLRPDEITFIGVLSACVHIGLLEYGHPSKIEHYSCMVDLMALAGHLEEAWDSHEKIPGKEDALEPSNSWNYVVSSKIYATTDRLDDSAMMLGLMRERGVSKTPGCSCVEVNGNVLAAPNTYLIKCLFKYMMREFGITAVNKA